MRKDKINEAIELLRQWAMQKLETGQEPPWATDQYKALVSMLSAVKQSRESIILLEDLQQLEMQQITSPHQGENIVLLDSARPRPIRVEVTLPI